MDAQIDCPHCGKHKAILAVSIGPTFAVDTNRCTACGQVVCGEAQHQLLRLVHVRRRRAKR
jgi:transcription elongation factor Elf1